MSQDPLSGLKTGAEPLILLSHTRDKGLYLESLLEFQWGAGTRPRFAFMRTAEILYTSGG